MLEGVNVSCTCHSNTDRWVLPCAGPGNDFVKSKRLRLQEQFTD